jgi:hypothetical protein
VSSYFYCRWRHDDANEPVDLYSEIDDSRYETRKVYVWADGRRAYADEQEAVGDTQLGDQVVPPLNEINGDPQFEAREMTKQEFEEIWSKRK